MVCFTLHTYADAKLISDLESLLGCNIECGMWNLNMMCPNKIPVKQNKVRKNKYVSLITFTIIHMFLNV
jgi:hypothetical protein